MTEKAQSSASAADSAPLSLNDIRKAIPKEAFEKSLSKSLFYMVFDYCVWGAALFVMSTLVNSSLWAALPFWAQAVACIVYWNIVGFYMWCIFVVGHDCGHTTFSEHQLLNDVLGHVMHASILVPFYPWQLSHRRHHMYHNHVDKDYSYAWVTPEQEAKKPVVMTFFHNSPLLSFFLPFYGWFLYLLGFGDGCHWLPVPTDRLWRETPVVEYWKCLLSTATVIASFCAQYAFYGDLNTMALYFLAPLVMAGWWLVTVTYLQHHNEHSIVYDDEDWKFAEAAFETVDRKYGYGIDDLHHNITDGHLVHHLFFTQIPHYNLLAATEAVKGYLREKNLIHLYRYEETLDFPQRIHSYIMNHGFRCQLANGKTVKSKKNL